MVDRKVDLGNIGKINWDKLRSEIKKSSIDEKYGNIWSKIAGDDDILNAKELEQLKNDLASAIKDNVITKEEAEIYLQSKQLNKKDADNMLGFMLQLGNASKAKSLESAIPDGAAEEYKNTINEGQTLLTELLNTKNRPTVTIEDAGSENEAFYIKTSDNRSLSVTVDDNNDITGIYFGKNDEDFLQFDEREVNGQEISGYNFEDIKAAVSELFPNETIQALKKPTVLEQEQEEPLEKVVEQTPVIVEEDTSNAPSAFKIKVPKIEDNENLTNYMQTKLDEAQNFMGELISKEPKPEIKYEKDQDADVYIMDYGDGRQVNVTLDDQGQIDGVYVGVTKGENRSEDDVIYYKNEVAIRPEDDSDYPALDRGFDWNAIKAEADKLFPSDKLAAAKQKVEQQPQQQVEEQQPQPRVEQQQQQQRVEEQQQQQRVEEQQPQPRVEQQQQQPQVEQRQAQVQQPQQQTLGDFTFTNGKIENVQIDARAAKITNKIYTSEIKLPSGAEVPEDGSMPPAIMMKLPAKYGENKYTKLTYNAENGTYMSRYKDMAFKLEKAADGAVTLTAVNDETLSAKRAENLQKWTQAKAAKTAKIETPEQAQGTAQSAKPKAKAKAAKINTDVFKITVPEGTENREEVQKVMDEATAVLTELAGMKPRPEITYAARSYYISLSDGRQINFVLPDSVYIGTNKGEEQSSDTVTIFNDENINVKIPDGEGTKDVTFESDAVEAFKAEFKKFFPETECQKAKDLYNIRVEIPEEAENREQLQAMADEAAKMLVDVMNRDPKPEYEIGTDAPGNTCASIYLPNGKFIYGRYDSNGNIVAVGFNLKDGIRPDNTTEEEAEVLYNEYGKIFLNTDYSNEQFDIQYDSNNWAAVKELAQRVFPSHISEVKTEEDGSVSQALNRGTGSSNLILRASNPEELEKLHKIFDDISKISDRVNAQGTNFTEEEVAKIKEAIETGNEVIQTEVSCILYDKLGKLPADSKNEVLKMLLETKNAMVLQRLIDGHNNVGGHMNEVNLRIYYALAKDEAFKAQSYNVPSEIIQDILANHHNHYREFAKEVYLNATAQERNKAKFVAETIMEIIEDENANLSNKEIARLLENCRDGITALQLAKCQQKMKKPLGSDTVLRLKHVAQEQVSDREKCHIVASGESLNGVIMRYLKTVEPWCRLQNLDNRNKSVEKYYNKHKEELSKILGHPEVVTHWYRSDEEAKLVAGEVINFGLLELAGWKFPE